MGDRFPRPRRLRLLRPLPSRLIAGLVGITFLARTPEPPGWSSKKGGKTACLPRSKSRSQT
ncbi:hypothetical protein [Methanoculleus chikugoensis]|uniref:hypothetical protein n=1 Tax=Methanoculleus chikugoensis TaxID=118126 RepID=UPI001FB3560E|nr:hypothetical protein [Methanoculleus chikugoensis]